MRKKLDFIMFFDEERTEALAEFLNLTEQCEIEGIKENGYEYSYGDETYLVLTDDEADDEATKRVESYVDEYVLSEIPERYRFYFDEERFIDDCLTQNGRGHTLASYDGTEHEITTASGETYYIYRIN